MGPRAEALPLLVLHYDQAAQTARCLASILQAGYAPEQIYCLDNGSRTDPAEPLRRRYPRVQFRRIEKNRGFSGGVNEALRWAFDEGFSSAFFLSNDTVLHRDAPEKCRETAATAGAGMVAPRVLSLKSPATTESIGGGFDPAAAALRHHRAPGLPPLLGENDYVPGAAFWLSRDTFLSLNGMDESYHTYWEDVDFSFRARRRGILLARCYDARVGHAIGKTCHKNPLYTAYYYQRNRIRFCEKFLTPKQRETATTAIRDDLEKLARRWGQKNDAERLNYLPALRRELAGERSPAPFLS
ncbi:MAG TPA: glycosyltransferase [Elusimicrobiota bacterium]|nr:glycosyltransferase [Elusimicrobiota bacterium]